MSLSTLLPDPVIQKTRNLAARGQRLVGRMTAAIRTLPDFLIIGTAKGGTTSLYRYLSQHPDIAPALRKEIHFFDEYYYKGVNWYRSFFPTLATRARHIRATSQQLQTGEATPYYLFHPLVPERVHELLPGIRLIVLLRDPVSRAYSQYQHMRREGHEPLSFSDAIQEEHRRSHRRFSYVSRGLYAAQIYKWLCFFEMSQFHFVKSEDLFNRPEEELQRTGAFLGLRPLEWKASSVFNQGRYDLGLEPSVQRHLQEVYRGPNEELAKLLGPNFNWVY